MRYNRNVAFLVLPMLGSLSMAAAAAIAKVVLDKFYEGLGSKLGEKAIEAASAPIQKLGEVVLQRCFPNQDRAKAVLEAAGQGSEEALVKLREHLLKRLDDAAIAQALQPIAQEIQQILIQIDDDSLMVLNNYGDGPVYQTKTGPNNTNFFGGTHSHGK